MDEIYNLRMYVCVVLLQNKNSLARESASGEPLERDLSRIRKKRKEWEFDGRPYSIQATTVLVHALGSFIFIRHGVRLHTVIYPAYLYFRY